MTEVAHTITAESNLDANKCDPKKFWRDFFRQMFPEKTDASAACMTGTSVSAARQMLRGRNGISSSALINLLRSPIGDKVLDAVAGNADWRRLERRLLEIEELKTELKKREQALGL
jgi:hypothetical protein